MLALAGMAATARGEAVTLNQAVGHPVLPANKKHTTWLKIDVTGVGRPEKSQRAPVNVCLVIDKSGSMAGDRIRYARDAAKTAVRRLAPFDIVSVVAYDNTVRVLVPATKCRDKDAICAAIDRLTPDSGTALFSGVSKGAEEVRKFAEKGLVNRVILLSDGQANVGPSSPRELGDLGMALAREGISVSTIGVGDGYNEDLMSQLASKSDGSHSFINNPAALATVFESELRDVMSVVAQEVTLGVVCAEGVRPVRFLGREGEISGQKVTAHLQQLYADQEKFLLLEVEVSAGEDGTRRKLADTIVMFRNLATGTAGKLRGTVHARHSSSEAEVTAAEDRLVMIAVAAMKANERTILAIQLRDNGEIQRSQELLHLNGVELRASGERYKSQTLEELGVQNFQDSESFKDGDRYNLKRKELRYDQQQFLYQNRGNVDTQRAPKDLKK